MKTKIELDQNFDYPDGKRNLFHDLIKCVIIGWVLGIGVVYIFSIIIQ